MSDEINSRVQAQEDRRRFDRARLIIDLFVDGKDITGVANTKDIGGGGLYMNTQTELPEGSVLLVRIPFGEDRQVVTNAEVVYCNPGIGVGLRFHGLSEEDRGLIEREVAKI